MEMMFDDTYRQVRSSAEGLFRDKGSKFIARAFAVCDEEEIKVHLADLRKEYHDARHHCYAWVLGASGEASRANDDGEPSGSAGLPILNQLRSAGLTNTLVVVVRYFGGTKLGIPGLIAAYKSAARQAIENAGIEVLTLKEHYQLDFPYDSTSNVMRILSQFDAGILGQQFDAMTHMKVAVRLSQAEKFTHAMEGIGLKAVYSGRS